MLCEKCGQREARVKITRIINGVSETHHYCRECSQEMTGRKNISSNEWSQAIFKLLREMFIQNAEEDNSEMNEKASGLVCPTCGRTYREFAEKGVFGCSDCYEAFEPMLSSALVSLQGTASHQGNTLSKSSEDEGAEDPFEEEAVSPEEELVILEAKLQEAVREENYEAAARYRDEIRALKEKDHG